MRVNELANTFNRTVLTVIELTNTFNRTVLTVIELTCNCIRMKMGVMGE